jgi:hypothetical protein
MNKVATVLSSDDQLRVPERQAALERRMAAALVQMGVSVSL